MLRTFQIDAATLSAPYAWYFIGIEKGYYAEEGIKLELLTAASNTSVPSVLAGEMPFTSGSSAALTAILKGGALKIILTNMDRPGYELWSNRPEVRSLADLQGKMVGIIGRGDTMEIATRIVLGKAGLDPNGVAFVPLGAGAARLAALQSGSVDAAVLGVSDVQRYQQGGAKGVRLSDMTRDVRMLFSGLATSDRLIREDPNLVAGFVRATIKSREYFRRYKEQTLQILATYNHSGRDVNEPDYDNVLATMTADGTLDEDTQSADAKIRAAIVGAETIRPAAEIYDYSVVRTVNEELRRSGWQPSP